MNAYAAVVSTRFRGLLQYRAAALAGLFTQAFFGLVRIMILEAFYRSSAAPQPMTFAQVVDYVWLSQAMFALFPWSGDADVREAIRSGNIAYELCRPLDMFALWYCRALAGRAAPLALRMAPMLVIAIAVLPLVGLGPWRLGLPHDVSHGLLWAASVLAGIAVSAALSTLVNITLLWTINGAGMGALLGSMATILGGLVIPLPLFPAWAQPLIYALPFPGMMDLPARIYAGNLSHAQAGLVLVHQIAWTLVLVAIGRYLLARGMRRLVVQGG